MTKTFVQNIAANNLTAISPSNPEPSLAFNPVRVACLWYVPGTRVTESPEDMGYRFVYAMEGEFDHE